MKLELNNGYHFNKWSQDYLRLKIDENCLPGYCEGIERKPLVH